MSDGASSRQCQVGIVGLDLPGREFACSIVEKGVTVAAFDGDPQHVQSLRAEVPGAAVHVASTVKELVGLLSPCRTVMYTGADLTGDAFLELLGRLEATDLFIDAGHCYFKDCENRARLLAEHNIRYLDMAILDSGKAGRGRVRAIGGRPETFMRSLPILESIAARGLGRFSLTYAGPTAAGHFVKMIFDAVEHSLAQLSLETLALLKRQLNLDDSEARRLAGTWPAWGSAPPAGDESTRWASQAARELGLPIPAIDAAGGFRLLTDLERANNIATTPFRQPIGRFGDDLESVRGELRNARDAAALITYAQGLSLLTAGSQRYGFDIDVPGTIRLWKECCGDRAGLLEEMALTFEATPALGNLLDDDSFSERVMEQQERLRHAVWRAGLLGASAPVLTAALDYLDSLRGAWLPVNLIDVPRQQWRAPVPRATEAEADWASQ